jgi:methionyl-tRNA formyltransferase
LSLRVIFMGTPQLACASLSALLDAPALQVIQVVTQPDRPKGRALKITPSPVKELAMRRGIAVEQPPKARDEQFISRLRQLQPDLIAVAAYGQILPESLLSVPRFGCLNVHPSLLPRYRGAAPIQWAILNDDRETGVTIMKMDVGLDTGDILSQAKTPISDQDDAETLYDRLARLGADLLVETIPRYVSEEIRPVAQPSAGAVYARKIGKEDGCIDWSKPARHIWNQVRGLLPWPGAFTRVRSATPWLLKIWKAQIEQVEGKAGEILAADKTGIIVGCGSQALRIECVQREGGRRLSPKEFLAGCALQPGQKLGQE